MRCYRFNGKRSKDILRKYKESTRRGSYQISTCRSKMLKSGFFENQTWGALHKCWKGYIIALNRFEVEEMREYATRIQRLQHELGLEISQFPWLGMSESGIPQDDWDEEMDRILDGQLQEYRRMKEEDRSEPSF